MNNTRFVLFAFFAVASFVSIAGCAADGSDAEDGTDDVDVSIEENISPRYMPRVSRMDIIAGGGHCASSLCTINGTSWQCSGAGSCTYLGRGY